MYTNTHTYNIIIVIKILSSNSIRAPLIRSFLISGHILVITFCPSPRLVLLHCHGNSVVL